MLGICLLRVMKLFVEEGGETSASSEGSRSSAGVQTLQLQMASS